MEAEIKRHKINELAKWLNEKNPRHIANVVALDSEAPEIRISHKDGGSVQYMRHTLIDIDAMATVIDHDYAIFVELSNGRPSLCMSFSIT